jgi:hypothetical protein
MHAGEVRVIHFPFDVEGDTAMCVASEMVQELDLEGQDVIKLADMIDSAVLLAVSCCSSGFSEEAENARIAGFLATLKTIYLMSLYLAGARMEARSVHR